MLISRLYLITMREINAILTIAHRDFLKLLRDRSRILATFIFPFLFIGVLGGSLQANIDTGYNFLTFVFTGVLGQTVFQSTAAGIISLIEDRENDFSQEIFVSPISRYTIIFGKIVGESVVALTQLIGIIFFGIIIGVTFTISQMITLLPFFLIACLFGGSFGVFVLSNLKSQRSANQIFPFVIFPQFFLAGIFNPIKQLPPILLIASRLSPMTYAIDLIRSVFYTGSAAYDKTVLFSIPVNLAVIAVFFTLFMVSGTYLFIRNERNR